jgi:hypothetical protein
VLLWTVAPFVLAAWWRRRTPGAGVAIRGRR